MEEQAKEGQPLRSEIHFRINEVSADTVAGTCGDRNYQIHPGKEGATWFFQDAPEERHHAESVHRALYEVVRTVQEEPEDPSACYCAVCEEMRASPLRVFHATVLFDNGVSNDYVFLTTGASEKSFRTACKRAARRAQQKSKAPYEACARFLVYMGLLGFTPTQQFCLGDLDVEMRKDGHGVKVTVHTPR